MNAVAHFSQSYAEARDKFLAAARLRGAKLMHHAHPTEEAPRAKSFRWTLRCSAAPMPPVSCL